MTLLWWRGTELSGLVLLVLCSVTLCAEDPAELAAAGSVAPGQEFMVTPGGTGSGGVQDFKRLSSDYTRNFQQQIQYNQEMRTRVSLPRKPAQPITYSKVPWFSLKANSMTHQQFTYDDCELYCTTYVSCRSFSYNFHGKTCISSDSSMAYDPNFVFFTKKTDAQGKPLKTTGYEEFAGMKFEVSGKVASRGRSKEECAYLCTRAKSGCSGYSYSDVGNICIRTAEPLHYSTNYDYYEKNEESSSRKRNQEEQKENNAKKYRKHMFTVNFEEAKKLGEVKFQEAVDKKEAEALFEKIAEKHMFTQGEIAKETRKKFDLAVRKERRLKNEAQEASQAVKIQEKKFENVEKRKELAEKDKMQAVTSSEKTDAEVEITEAKTEEKDAEQDKRESTGTQVEVEEEAREAGKKERQDARLQKEAQRKAEKDAIVVNTAKLAETVDAKKEDLSREKLNLVGTQEEERDTKSDERIEKRRLANDQAASERKQKQCASELDESKRKEVCAKASQLRKDASGEFVAENAALQEDISVSKKAQGSEKEIKADRQNIRMMKKRQQMLEKKSKAEATKKEASQKADIEAAKRKNENDEKNRKATAIEDKKLLKLAQAKEQKSKRAQIMDIRNEVIEKQEDAKQDEINAKATMRFNHVLKKETYESAAKETEKLRVMKLKDQADAVLQQKLAAEQNADKLRAEVQAASMAPKKDPNDGPTVEVEKEDEEVASEKAQATGGQEP